MTNIAGRILIIPKGDYDANASYSMLDLVSYNGTSWLARKDATGIEPSVANSEYWQNMFSMDFMGNILVTEILSEPIESIDAGANMNSVFNIPEVSGFTPLLILYCTNTKDGKVLPFKTAHRYVGVSQVNFGIRNTGIVAISNFQCVAYCVYIKNT